MNKKGFTMIEMAIAIAVLGVVMAATFSVLGLGQKSFEDSVSTGYIETQMRTTIDNIQKDIMYGKIDSITGSFTTLQYKIPVDWDNDGDVTNPAGTIEYGYNGTTLYAGYSGPRLDWSAVVTFVPEKVVAEQNAAGIVTPYELERYNLDINLDGDMVDAFYIGRLERHLYASAADLPFVGGTNPVEKSSIAANIILNFYDMGGDITGDGIPDKLFRMLDVNGNEVFASPVMIEINPLTVTFSADKKTVIGRNSYFRVALRNTQ